MNRTESHQYTATRCLRSVRSRDLAKTISGAWALDRFTSSVAVNYQNLGPSGLPPSILHCRSPHKIGTRT